jgi:hypothetical protein
MIKPSNMDSTALADLGNTLKLLIETVAEKILTLFHFMSEKHATFDQF